MVKEDGIKSTNPVFQCPALLLFGRGQPGSGDEGELTRYSRQQITVISVGMPQPRAFLES